ncbi:MAG: pyridoxamine 5'-phosphate oxidase family protein [Rhodoferax sp.]|nr:pyridoxamine 5'-phosphate oxidase family protein [Rhodoferax sp.]
MTLAERVQQHLRSHHVATLASSGVDGPWAAAVFYVHDGWDLYFLSSPTSRHCLNFTHNAQVAVTIQRDYDDWPGIKGVQLQGLVEELVGADEANARDQYGRKFPIVGKLAQAPAAIVKALAKVRWYRVRPQRLLYIDNTLGFGHREEVDLLSPPLQAP